MATKTKVVLGKGEDRYAIGFDPDPSLRAKVFEALATELVGRPLQMDKEGIFLAHNILHYYHVASVHKGIHLVSFQDLRPKKTRALARKFLAEIGKGEEDAD